MGLIVASSGTDFMSGRKENVISDYEGTAMLAPLRNLVPDPGFNQWKMEDGTLRYWDFGEPPKPSHWMMFVKDTHTQRNYSRQMTGPIRLEKEIFNLTDALIPGAGPIDKDMLIDIAKPLKPKVKAYEVSGNVGFPAGWYCIAYGYDVSKKFRIGKRLTGPGPRSEPFELGQGDGFYVPLPTAPPEGVNSIVYYLTEPQNASTPEMAQVKALSANMFIQDKVDVKSKSDIVKFYGPLDRRYKYKKGKKNETYIGSIRDMADLVFSTEPSAYGTNVSYDRTEITTGYKIVTEQGKSVTKVSKGTNMIEENGATVLWINPEELDEEAIGWVPVFYAEDPITAEITQHTVVNGAPITKRRRRRGKRPKKTTTLPYFKVDERAPIYSTDPNTWPDESGTSLVESDDLEDYIDSLDAEDELEEEPGTFSVTGAGKLRGVNPGGSRRTGGRLAAGFPESGGSGEEEAYQPMGTSATPTSTSMTGTTTMDETGVEAPTDAPEVPTVVLLNNSGLTPGTHHVKTALFVDEQEGPTSEPTKEKVEMGEGLKIHRPKWHDKLTNSDLGDRDIDGKPLDWDFLHVTPDYLPEKNGVIQLTDEDELDEDADFFVTPPAELNPDHDRYVVTFSFLYRKHVSGGMEVLIEEYDAADVKLATHRVDRFSRRKVGRKYQHEYRLSSREEDVATPTLTKISPTATYLKCRVRGLGSRQRQGPRNKIARMADFGCFEGWTVPYTIDVDLEAAHKTSTAPAPTPENEDYVYNKFTRPHGGYCVVRLGHDDGPIDATFDTKDFTVFETGTNEGWVQNVSDFNSMVAELREEAGMFSKYGVYMAGDPADGDGRTSYIQKIFNPETEMTVSWDMYIDSYNEENLALGAIRDANNEILALVSITALGTVLLQYNTPGGLSQPTIAIEGLDDGMIVHFKLSLNILEGTVSLQFGSDEDQVDEVARIEGIDFSDFEDAIGAVLGPAIPGFEANRFATWQFIYGKIEVTNLGEWSSLQRLPGNYIEYYGPRGTPRNALYGPTGMRLPATEFTDYSLGVNVWYHDMSEGSNLFQFRAMDEDHNVLMTYTPLVPDFSTGYERRWERYTQTIHTPQDTAYLEFYGNKLGQGLLKIHGLQVEEGDEATPFNMDMIRHGNFSIYFSNAQDQVESDDPAAELGRVVKLRNVAVAGTDTPDVSYIARYRSGDTYEELDAQPLEFDFAALDTTKAITEVRIDMSSTLDDQTPEIRQVALDVQRPYSQLLKADGTEYRGGTLAWEIGTPHTPPNVEMTDLASGAKDFDEWGYEQTPTISFKVWSFRRSTTEEISGTYQHVLETDDKRYTVYTDEPIAFTPKVGSRKYFSDGREYFQVEEADVTGYIMAEETLL